MRQTQQPSLAGGVSGPPPTHLESVSVALSRIRSGVVRCCWIAALCLLAQTVIWGLVSFTDLRWADAEVPATASAVAAQTPGAKTRTSLDEPAARGGAGAATDPDRLVSRYAPMLRVSAALARGAGTIAVLALLPLVVLGVLLAAGSATEGVDRAVSAFGWALVGGLLALPLAGLVGLPWADGAFWSYERLVADVDAAPISIMDGALSRTIELFARFLLLPLACAGALAIVGMRFSAGVEAGAMRREDLALDPTLEREASNIKPGTLHGGRTASAMAGAIVKVEEASATVRHLSAGDAPRRLI